MALSAGVYWHPLDLPHYVTKQDLTGRSEARVVVPVTAATSVGEGEEYVLSAVWAPTYAELLAGSAAGVLASVAFSGVGLFSSAWQLLETDARADVCVGMILEVQVPTDDLAFGAADLRVR